MNEEFSCIKRVEKTVQLPLPLSFISNEIAGISEILESWKRQYVKLLHGVVVDYKNVSLISRTGYIGINKPFIYYFVKATFDLFCPNVGDIVKGKINRISREHIGCLIQGTINVTIHLSQHSSTELSQFVNLNKDILFEIAHFDYERKMIRVKGEITPKCLQLMKDLFPPEIISANNTSVNAKHVKYNFDSEIEKSRSENSNDGSCELFSESLSILNDIEKNDIKSELQYGDSESLLDVAKKKKKKSSKKKSESSFLSELSTADEIEKFRSKNSNDGSCELFSESLSILNDIEKNDIKSELLYGDSESLLDVAKKKKKKSSKKKSESSFLSELSTADEIEKSRSKNSNDGSCELFSESLSILNNIEKNDIKSELLYGNSESLIDVVKKKKSSKKKSESSFLSELSTADEMPKEKHKKKVISLSEKEFEVKDKSLLNQSSDVHQYDSLIENLSSINSDVQDYVKKEGFWPKKEILEEGHEKKSKKRKRESSLSESEIKKKHKKKKAKAVNGSEIDSPQNASTTQNNGSVSSTMPSKELKVLKKKKHKKKPVSEKSKLKKKKNKLLASGDVLKKDSKSKKKKLKKHKESKSHKKIKSKNKKEKIHSSKNKKSVAIKSKTS